MKSLQKQSASFTVFKQLVRQLKPDEPKWKKQIYKHARCCFILTLCC